MAKKNEINENLPDGWDEARIQEIIAYYERNMGRVLSPGRYKKRNDTALVEIPKVLLPDIWRLIAAYEEKQERERLRR